MNDIYALSRPYQCCFAAHSCGELRRRGSLGILDDYEFDPLPVLVVFCDMPSVFRHIP